MLGLARLTPSSLFKQLVFSPYQLPGAPEAPAQRKAGHKTKSNKELHGFLFNDFLLLTYMVKQFVVSSASGSFSARSPMLVKMYKAVGVSWQLALGT